MKMFSKFRVIMFIAALGIIGLLSGCGSDTNDVVPTAAHAPEAQAANVLNAITVRGAVESRESRNVYSMHGHRVESLYVNVGDHVTAGQVLAVLNVEDIEFAIEQQTVALSLARLNNQTAVSDAERMLEMATRNLANNTNVMILHAEANLSAADANLTEAQRMHDIAARDSDEGNDMQMLSAEAAVQQAHSAVVSARTELETLEDNLARLQIMYDAEFLSREELRQAQNAVTAARNWYNDTLTAYANAGTAQGHTLVQQGRTVEQSEIILQSARAARQTAQTLLTAERAAAQQEVELLRSALTNAEAATNVEQMEIALRQLERQLEDATITAPISGTVTASHISEGSIAAGLLFVIEDVENLRIITSFREYDISRIFEGMEVIITSDGTGNVQHIGEITRISPAATPNSPIVEFETEITVISEDTGLRLGMTTRIEVDLETGVS